jgi:hypothetical protein
MENEGIVELTKKELLGIDGGVKNIGKQLPTLLHFMEMLLCILMVHHLFWRISNVKKLPRAHPVVVFYLNV